MVHKTSLGRASNQGKGAQALQARPARVADKRKAVMAAALELFSRFGLHGTSIDQVAVRSGVSKSNLLYYFSSKEELYVSVLSDLLNVWLTPLDALDGAQDPREAIASYIRSKLALARDQPEASRLFCLEMVQGAPLLRGTLEVGVRGLLERKDKVIRAWAEQGLIAPIPTHHLMFTIWAITQHYADFAVQIEATVGKTLHDPEFFEETVKSVQSIVLQGVCPPMPIAAASGPKTTAERPAKAAAPPRAASAGKAVKRATVAKGAQVAQAGKARKASAVALQAKPAPAAKASSGRSMKAAAQSKVAVAQPESAPSQVASTASRAAMTPKSKPVAKPTAKRGARQAPKGKA